MIRDDRARWDFLASCVGHTCTVELFGDSHAGDVNAVGSDRTGDKVHITFTDGRRVTWLADDEIHIVRGERWDEVAA